MNCPSCLASSVGWLSSYWLTISISTCSLLAASLVFWWAWRRGLLREDAKTIATRRILEDK